jgi:hypothetical protein
MKAIVSVTNKRSSRHQGVFSQDGAKIFQDGVKF